MTNFSLGKIQVLRRLCKMNYFCIEILALGRRILSNAKYHVTALVFVMQSGVLENQSGVANAFRISDSSGPNANHQVRFDGRTLIYGF